MRSTRQDQQRQTQVSQQTAQASHHMRHICTHVYHRQREAEEVTQADHKITKPTEKHRTSAESYQQEKRPALGQQAIVIPYPHQLHAHIGGKRPSLKGIYLGGHAVLEPASECTMGARQYQ